VVSDCFASCRGAKPRRRKEPARIWLIFLQAGREGGRGGEVKETGKGRKRKRTKEKLGDDRKNDKLLKDLLVEEIFYGGEFTIRTEVGKRLKIFFSFFSFFFF